MTDRNLAQRARDSVGLSQRAFAKLLGVSYVTVARWETGFNPSGAAHALLRVIASHPEQVLGVLGEQSESAD